MIPPQGIDPISGIGGSGRPDPVQVVRELQARQQTPRQIQAQEAAVRQALAAAGNLPPGAVVEKTVPGGSGLG